MRRGLAAAFVIAATVQPAAAQDVWGGRGRISLSAGMQPDAAGLSQATSVEDYLEPTEITADRSPLGAPFYDVSFAVRVAGGLGVAAGVSGLDTRGDARVAAAVPHPFYFDRPRDISGEAPGLRRTETGVHAGLAYLIGLSRRADVMVMGGATYLRVRQDVVSDVSYSEAYPYETATFSTAQVVRRDASTVGYHAAVDLSVKLGARWGVGGLVRFSRAEVPFEVNGAETASVEVGGIQAGGGVRFAF